MYTDDRDGNVDFGDLSRSYCSFAALSEAEQASIKSWLKPYYDEGVIMDVYVGPLGLLSTFMEERAMIDQCLPDLSTL